MIGYPPLYLALLQGLLVALVLLTPPMVLAFGGKLKVTGGDVALLLLVIPVFAAGTAILFVPFEGDWADRAFAPIIAFRSLIVGGSLVVLGMLITRWRGLLRLRPAQGGQMLAAGFVIGALWGLTWGLSGWLLNSIGMTGNG
jgi:hypothetical protein